MKLNQNNDPNTLSESYISVENALDSLERSLLSELSAEYQNRVFELTNKLAKERMKKGQAITSPDDSKKAIAQLLQLKQEEVVAVLFLDNQHRIISFEELFHWSISSAVIHTRVLVKQALAYNSSAIIMAHNHPSGVCEPSHADRAITKKVKEAMDLIEVRLLDHFVVGVEWIYSFAEQGVL